MPAANSRASGIAPRQPLQFPPPLLMTIVVPDNARGQLPRQRKSLRASGIALPLNFGRAKARPPMV